MKPLGAAPPLLLALDSALCLPQCAFYGARRPYDDRSCSNFVHMRRAGGDWHVSETMTDWLFLAAEFTPLCC